MTNTSKFEHGQIVVFKTWEEMEEEFGVNRFGAINCMFTFTKAMKSELSGRQYIYIRKHNETNLVEIESLDEGIRGNQAHKVYSISEDMLKLYEDQEETAHIECGLLFEDLF